MSSESKFDFNNEGDCILAGKPVPAYASQDVSSSQSFNFDFTDLMMLSAYCMMHDTEMNEDYSQHLKKYNEVKMPDVMPFVDVIDMNKADEDLVNEIQPNPAIIAGIKGVF